MLRWQPPWADGWAGKGCHHSTAPGPHPPVLKDEELPLEELLACAEKGRLATEQRPLEPGQPATMCEPLDNTSWGRGDRKSLQGSTNRAREAGVRGWQREARMRGNKESGADTNERWAGKKTKGPTKRGRDWPKYKCRASLARLCKGAHVMQQRVRVTSRRRVRVRSALCRACGTAAHGGTWRGAAQHGAAGPSPPALCLPVGAEQRLSWPGSASERRLTKAHYEIISAQPAKRERRPPSRSSESATGACFITDELVCTQYAASEAEAPRIQQVVRER